jgi:glucose-1-phosphate adenylyltransferase
MATLDDVLAIILAAGKGTRLYNLTKERAKPAVPFAGYRIIDIPMNNLVNAGIPNIDILIEYKSDSLQRHLTKWNTLKGDDWNIISIPTQRRSTDIMSEGIGDSIYNHWFNRQELSFVPSIYLVLSGDQITKFDPRKMIRAHQKVDADITMRGKRVRIDDTDFTQFGFIQVDADFNVVGFVEKPEQRERVPEIPGEPGFALLNEAILAYRPEVLDHYCRVFYLKQKGQKEYDQSKHIIAPLVKEGKLRIKAFMDEEYWEDVGTLDALYDANMDLLGSKPAFNLYEKGWWYKSPVEKYSGNPAKVSDIGNMIGSIPSNGSIISGLVKQSVLSYGVETLPGSKVKESILFDKCIVGKGAVVEGAIFDKSCKIGEGSVSKEENLDFSWVGGAVRGNQRHNYRIKPLDAAGTVLLVQRENAGQDIEKMIDKDGFPMLGEDGYISQISMKNGNFMEFVLTPEHRMVFSKYSRIPAGFII